MDYAAPPPDAGSSIQDYTNPEWTAAKRGLVNYRRALIAKVIVGITGGLLLVVVSIAAVGGGLEALDSVMWISFLLVAASLALGLWTLYGLINFAKVPDETGARGLAMAALILSAILFLAEVYFAYRLGSFLFGGHHSLMDLAKMSDNSWELLIRLGTLVSFLCLVFSLKTVARYVGALDVVGMINSFMGVLYPIIGLVVIVAIIPHPIVAGLAGLALLVLYIIALVKFLRILNVLGQAIGGLDVSKVFD